MNQLIERLKLPLVMVCFLLFVIRTASLQAEESTTASLFTGDGEITLTWSHDLLTTGAINFSAVSTNAEILEEGIAVADAAAQSSPDSTGSGQARVTISLEGTVVGNSAFAQSRALAHNFFLLQNTSNERVNVKFVWSADWLVSGVIDQPGIDRSEMGLQLTLAKSFPMYGGMGRVNKIMTNRLIESMMPVYGFSGPAQGEVFSKYVAVHLPDEGTANYHLGNTSNEFEVLFGPKQSYLFGLTAQASGLATVSIEGCSDTFWSRHIRSWPINPATKFFDVFGFGPENMTVWLALVYPQAKVDEPRFFKNAVVALLNARSSKISYFIDDPDYLATLVKSTFESGDLSAVDALADDLEFYNNVGASDIMCESSLL